MTKDERQKLKETILYLYDAMLMLDTIEQMNNCNTCGIKKKCGYCPRLGENVRYNCPLWEVAEDDSVKV